MDAWKEVQPLFIDVAKSIDTKQDMLAGIGLAGNQLRLKVIVLYDYDLALSKAWNRFNDWLVTAKGEEKKFSVRKRSKVRWIVNLLGRFCGQADTIIDTVSLVVPNAHGIKEFKETIERFSS